MSDEQTDLLRQILDTQKEYLDLARLATKRQRKALWFVRVFAVVFVAFTVFIVAAFILSGTRDNGNQEPAAQGANLD